MKTHSAALVGFFSLFFSAACGSNVTDPAAGGNDTSGAAGGSSLSQGGAPGTTGSGGAPASHCSDSVTAADFQHCLASTFCPAIKPCCETDGFGFAQDNCETRIGKYVSQISPSKPANGTFDAMKAKACVDAAAKAASTCPATADDTLAFVTACPAVFSGTLAPGAACSKDQDCAPPADGDGIGSCFGNVCAQYSRGKAGDACVVSYASTISADGETSTELQGTNPPAMTGIECDAADGLTCDLNALAGPDPKCIALGTSGSPCLNTDDCSNAFNCTQASPGNKGTCTPRIAVGADCDPESVNPCVGGAFCAKATSSCTPMADAGGACDQFDACKSGGCVDHHCAAYLVSASLCKG